ncbi:MAG: anaerobic ribonucleoside-triphosphate reductase activating protein [Candidatus Pacearchaeota archaeon]|nr:anaerobic ribonucleoside-triphosphate reductase activating protein [Candidatus Pacearchaeota archaeon]
MLIKGFQKLSMIDYPENVASVIFLFGCNFNCGFCHNPELRNAEKAEEVKTYTEKEVLDHLEQNLGFIDGVVFSGGEPTLSPDLPEFIKKVYDLGLKIKIDTNGTNPEMLQELLSRNMLDCVSMDFKASFENYENIVRAKVDLDKIKKSIDIIKKVPHYEFRITLAPGITKDDILKISEYLKSVRANKLFVLQQFRPNKCNDKELERLEKTSDSILEDFSQIAKPFFEKVLIRKE